MSVVSRFTAAFCTFSLVALCAQAQDSDGRLMKLHETPWTVDGAPILGTYSAAKDKLEDLRRIRDVGMNVILGDEADLDVSTPTGAFCQENGIKVLHHLTSHVYHGVKLLEPIDAEQTTIPLYFSHRVPDIKSNVVWIDDELIEYGAMTEAGLVDCKRGQGGTKPAPHRNGVILFWPEPCAEEINKIKDSPNLFGYYVLDDSPGDAASALRALYRTVQETDPGRRHPVCAGFGDAGSIVNLVPGVCDIMFIYWYPVGTKAYDRDGTAMEVQRMLSLARSRVPGIPFVGIYQAFDGTIAQTGQGVPNAEQLREQLEDFVREGASGLVAFISTARGLPGWADLPELGQSIKDAHREIRETGGLRVRPETDEMRKNRIQPEGHWEHPRPVPGVVPAWRLMGPFEDTEEKRLAAVFPPDEVIDFDAVYPVKFGRASWQVWETTTGVLGLTNLYGDHGALHNCLVYAVCDVTSLEEQSLLMHVGTDDDGSIRLNGKEVYHFEGGRGLDPEQDVIPVVLPKGTSRLTAKINNRAGMWGVAIRFTKPDGTPVENLEFDPPAGPPAKN